ncbi:hypothetical protein [Ferruginibacter albus]|uniref:hypothetical protein n=1 Tax=Ferruginibacter albus TaxID=2875540 RepID=UPI001CC7C68B|nr:hypothetical protein [Ferruginibacter albus]UAY52503.1 hypothetical protein K9M53_02145 [Ferruginibacter albus]
MSRNLFYIMVVSLFCCISSCKKYYFYPDENNPGLSRFTSRDYNVASAYINNIAYVNPFYSTLFSPDSGPTPQDIYINKINAVTGDTLNLTWHLENGDYRSYSLNMLLPVDNSFAVADFIRWNGKIFRNVSIRLDQFYGIGNLYITKLTPAEDGSNVLTFSGLFDGVVNDTIIITKGRFDFPVAVNRLNF